MSFNRIYAFVDETNQQYRSIKLGGGVEVRGVFGGSYTEWTIKRLTL